MTAVARSIRLGAIVLDRARNAPLRVVGRDHRPAGEHPDVAHRDPMARSWGVDPEDRVYECVFLPTPDDQAVTAPTRAYAYPASRPTRYPVEAALGPDARRIHTQVLVEYTAALLDVTWAEVDTDLGPSVPLDVAVAEAVVNANDVVDAAVPTEVLLEEARELQAANRVTATQGEGSA